MRTENNKVTLRVPAALRSYTDRQGTVEITGTTVGEALACLITRYPAVGRHLYDDSGTLRSFVGLYLNGEDVTKLEGLATTLSPGDKLAIIPAIAGGRDGQRQVDQSAIRTKQAVVAGLLIVAFVMDSMLLVSLVAAAMWLGFLAPRAAPFVLVYHHLLRPVGLVRPRVVPDNPEPHRFAGGVGAACVTGSALALYAGIPLRLGTDLDHRGACRAEPLGRLLCRLLSLLSTEPAAGAGICRPTRQPGAR